MSTYKIVRLYRDSRRKRTVRTRMTLEAAQRWCRDPETSSSTCKSAEAKRRTRTHGPWFDAYEEER